MKWFLTLFLELLRTREPRDHRRRRHRPQPVQTCENGQIYGGFATMLECPVCRGRGCPKP